MLVSRKPFKVCKYAQCDGLTRDRYCEEHEHIGQQEDRQRELDRYKDYTRYRRDEEATAFYSNSNWKKVRKYVMARDNHLCVDCLKDKKITKADVVHHIKYLGTHPELALDPSNLISICHYHHAQYHKSD